MEGSQKRVNIANMKTHYVQLIYDNKNIPTLEEENDKIKITQRNIG